MSFTDAILLFVFFGSLFVIGRILFQAFPLLSRIPVEGHPKVREGRTKRVLLFGRWERRVRATAEQIVKRCAPLVDALRRWFWSMSERVLRLERRYEFSKKSKPERLRMGRDVSEEVHLLLSRGHAELSEGRAERAEQTFVEILRMEPRNVEAYWGLVGVYREQKSEREALETLHFLTRLLPEDAEAWYELARESQSSGNLDDMLEAIERAVALESANPKYLDFLCEAAILKGRRDTALEAFRALEVANPDNQKLKDFRERIREL